MYLSKVLILVVVDNGLVRKAQCYERSSVGVLILVVVDNGLVLERINANKADGAMS